MDSTHYRAMGSATSPKADLPRIIHGISTLGNLYRETPLVDKFGIVGEILAHTPGTVVFDGAGKYGAGMALSCLGEALRHHHADPARIVISNKLGWRQAPLRGEPSFEPGLWKGLTHDAIQDCSVNGVLRCWEEGDTLLGAPWTTRLVSLHDPDEALAHGLAWTDLLETYAALVALRRRGVVTGVGVGVKDWAVGRAIADAVDLDWVMLACSLTVLRHPPELIAWIGDLATRGIAVINAAVFHGGFLIGGGHFDYRPIDDASAADADLRSWRSRFNAICAHHEVLPATACIAFGLLVPGVGSVTLNAATPRQAALNAGLGEASVPSALWRDLLDAGLVDRRCGFLPC